MARFFNGSTDKARTTNLPTTNTSNWTLFAWIFPISYIDSYFIENGYDGGGSGTGYSLRLTSSGEIKGNMGFVVSIASGIFVPIKKWSKCLLVNNAGNTTVWANGYKGNTTVTNTPFTPTNSYHVGYRENNVGGIVADFNGFVAHAAVWSRALNYNEISSLIIGEVLPSYFSQSLSIYTPLNTPEGTSIELDYSGNTNNLTLTGTSLGRQPLLVRPNFYQPLNLISSSAQYYSFLTTLGVG